MPNIDLIVAELPLDAPFRLKHEGMAVVVIRTESGVHAYKDVCPHAFWPLSRGTVSAGVLECAGHGWEFSVSTGRCLNAPDYCLTGVSAQLDGDVVHLHWDTPERVDRAASKLAALQCEPAVASAPQPAGSDGMERG